MWHNSDIDKEEQTGTWKSFSVASSPPLRYLHQMRTRANRLLLLHKTRKNAEEMPLQDRASKQARLVCHKEYSLAARLPNHHRRFDCFQSLWRSEEVFRSLQNLRHGSDQRRAYNRLPFDRCRYQLGQSILSRTLYHRARETSAIPELPLSPLIFLHIETNKASVRNCNMLPWRK